MSLEQFNVMMEADSVSTIKRLVESSYGISVLSARACMGAVEEGASRAAHFRFEHGAADTYML